jgi:hypothetical protein
LPVPDAAGIARRWTDLASVTRWQRRRQALQRDAKRVAAPMTGQANRGQVLALELRPARSQALPGAGELKPE